ncbi:hypothetical protein BHM03_00027362 [Ensete ventricosum]|nr:hypothetical protein BHM03_00027362 [Ensete ventricosum]
MVARAAAKAAGEGNPYRAYVTFLAGDGDYVRGAVGLAKGLRKLGSAYPMVSEVIGTWQLAFWPHDLRRVVIIEHCPQVLLPWSPEVRPVDRELRVIDREVLVAPVDGAVVEHEVVDCAGSVLSCAVTVLDSPFSGLSCRRRTKIR